tara:strand:+ start:8449 stop:9255 length:807 start_codon:yes stop_codon:yes gene_type:complete
MKKNQQPIIILITGANGQLGKTIHELYSKNKFGLDFKFVTKEDLDITEEEDVKIFFSKNSFDYCINCAAYTNVEQAEKTPDMAFKVNAEGVKNLASLCKENNVVLIHISTDYVFDGEKGEPYTPIDIPNPINEYGKSKLLGEQYIQEKLNNFFIVRTSWLYSKKYGKNFYRSIVEKAEKGEALSVTIDQIGCPTDTVNLAQYVFDLITDQKANFGIHHFCDKEVMTWYNFAKQILSENKLNNKTNLVEASKYITFARRPKYSVLYKSE